MHLPLSTDTRVGIAGNDDSIFSPSPQVTRLSIQQFVLKICFVFIAILFTNAALLVGAENDSRNSDSTSLRVLDSKTTNAKILSCDKNWKLTFIPLNAAVDSRSESVNASDLYCWGSWRAASTGQQLLLNDDGRVIGYLDAIDANEIKFDSTAGLESVVIPRKSARGVVFRPSVYKKFTTDELSKKDHAQKQARVILANGDQQSGEIVNWANNKLTLKTAAAQLTLEQRNLAAVLFGNDPDAKKNADQPATQSDKSPVKETSKQPSKVWLGFVDGSRVLANQLELVKEQWHVSLTSGGKIVADSETLCAIQPIDGRVTYLSDIEASGYKHIPWLSTTWPYERDRNVLKEQLQCNGRTAIKGLGMHSAARLSYNLDGAYDSLIGQIGIDDSTSGRGSAVCKIYIDTGDGKWQLKSESPILRGGQQCFELNADLRGAKRISLLVDYADHGDTLDHVDWLNVGLVRAKK